MRINNDEGVRRTDTKIENKIKMRETAVMDTYIERVVDPLDPSCNQIHNLSLAEARRRVLSGSPEAVREIDGSFALLARAGKTVRMARSMDRPMRYFLAKRC